MALHEFPKQAARRWTPERARGRGRGGMGLLKSSPGLVRDVMKSVAKRSALASAVAPVLRRPWADNLHGSYRGHRVSLGHATLPPQLSEKIELPSHFGSFWILLQDATGQAWTSVRAFLSSCFTNWSHEGGFLFFSPPIRMSSSLDMRVNVQTTKMHTFARSLKSLRDSVKVNWLIIDSFIFFNVVLSIPSTNCSFDLHQPCMSCVCTHVCVCFQHVQHCLLYKKYHEMPNNWIIHLLNECNLTDWNIHLGSNMHPCDTKSYSVLTCTLYIYTYVCLYVYTHTFQDLVSATIRL